MNIVMRMCKYGLRKNIIYTGKWIQRMILCRARGSYSQFGEDLIIAKLLGRSNDIRYVDCGSHDPKKFSNTYYFYKRGGVGICVDVLPYIVEKGKKVRPRDTYLLAACGGSKGEAIVYDRTFDVGTSIKPYIDNSNKIVGQHRVEQLTYPQILERCGWQAQFLDVDFITLDIEGVEMEFLRTIDFDSSPEIICVETVNDKYAIESFLNSKGYVAKHRTETNTIMQKERR